MEDYDDNHIRLAVIQNDIGYVKEKLQAVDEKISKNYLTKFEFEPIKNIIYGLIMLIFIAVVGSLVALVMQPGPPPNEQTKTTQK